MPIWIDLADLVITKEAIATKYPGGTDRFRTDLDFDPARLSVQEDGELFCLGAMDLSQLTDQLNALRTAGLTYNDKDPTNDDMVLVARYGGPLSRPYWLRANGIYVWHMNCAPDVQDYVKRIVRLSVDEFIAKRERGEIPLKTIVTAGT